MALTPDDVVTKQFQHVRFKEGFDPDEVDDFLDEIVVEWRKTIAENEELKAKLAAFESGEAAPVAAAPAAEAPKVEEPVVAEAPAAAPEAPAVEADAAPAAQSAGIIELAQRLHDEHVAEGKAQRDQLISEAQAQAASIVAEAEQKGREERARLEKERVTLEGRITELRNFERDYRSQLRSYIEGQLRDLDTTASSSGSTPVSAIGL
ncbi:MULTISPECIES: DivIVA domain-containing protein [Microbacterium]|jgi:DivIVA domain-containing protein|uniref:Cell wall synthesis protein Wag31 n=1 Tax=Microbacterium testaceum TaxID=2033 RepID=A0A147F7U2_MICTE|nr:MULTISPECIES: DivIVA domain-containing protein [Microbacterium]KTS05442.1 cell division protein [Microbacterium testaceum]KTS12153.1 cell division protein [Microbacterium testaceum]KTS66195.1 cell division protein [Microbacterium testaceum]KTS82468.1 cell division protein [Microbacterium testaceum]MDF2044788.1 DivIVA domain-containing protein [Microbacterium sp. Kw_RZR3]